MRQVKADFDFHAQPNSGEMSVVCGDVLTVIREDITGGWIEARNARGEVGLVPESYVSSHTSAPSAAPAAAPPPFVPSAPIPTATASSRPFDDWGASTFVAPTYGGGQSTPAAATPPTAAPLAGSLPARPVSHSTINDDFDDEWTDDDEETADHRLSVTAALLAGCTPSLGVEVASPRSHGGDGGGGGGGGGSPSASHHDDIAAGRKVSRRDSRGRRSVVSADETRLPRSGSHDVTLARRRSSGQRRQPHYQIVKSQSYIISPKEIEGHGGHQSHQALSVSQDTRSSALSRSHSAGATGERGGPQGQGRINRNINRFTLFVKSGMESYLLSDVVIPVPQHEKLELIVGATGPYGATWRPIDQYYTCTIDKPKKESKLKGLKSFIAYSLTSSASGIQVSRRYKHFDWLLEQLQNKYVMIPIPPLPEKQVAGRYEEDLIDHRKHILQLWVNKICRHPVISRSEVWLHFMSCTDEKQWKIGKRKAEKDEFVGGNFFHTVTFPTQPLQVHEVERQVEVFQRSVRSMEDSVRVMSERVTHFQKLFTGPVKQNWQKMAAAFSSLGQSFEADNNPASNKMVDALRHTAHHYHNMGEDLEKHTKEDMEPLVENLYSYKGTVQGIPDILSLHRQAVSKLRETERASSEGKISQADTERIRKRVDNTSYVLLAEMNHLNQEKVEDFKHTIGTYLRGQAEFYQRMANTLTELARHYN